MRLFTLLLVPVGLVTALPASAAGPEDGYLDLTPYISRVDKDRNTERQAGGVRAAFGWGWEGPWYSEVQVFGAILETEDFFESGELTDQSDFYMTGVGIDLAYNFGDRDGYTPYLLAGLGAVHDDVLPDKDDSTNAFVNVAAGITTQEISRRGIRLRSEIRFMHDRFQSGMNDWQLAFGISIPLRCPPTPPPTVAAAPPPKEDRGPVEVQTLDSDGDGVFDRDDRCPDTLPGAQVDSEGCVIANQVIKLENIQFETNSATLTPAAQDALLQVVRSLRNQPTNEIEIAGHTDSQGNANYNLKLSQDRANSVRTFMISNGIDAARLSANGYGEQQPVAPNDTPSGRAQNRRVEMRFR